MKAGDVAFSQGGGLAGWLIRTGDHSRYNHTRWVLDDQGTVLEALGGGAKVGRVQPGDVIASPAGMTDAQRAMVPAVAAGMEGKPYGYLDVAALGLAQIGLLKGWTEKRITDPATLFCSQLADEGLRRVGYQAFDDGRWAHNVTPGDLFDLAARNNWPMHVI